MRDIARNLENQITNMERTQAETIARTETVRVNNLGDYYIAQEQGKECFIVISAFDCCEECADTYPGNVFTMDDTDMLPPLHSNCRCSANFFRTNDLGESMTQSFDERFNQEREALGLS